MSENNMRFVKLTLLKAAIVPTAMVGVVYVFPGISLTGIILSAIGLLAFVGWLGYRYL